MLREGDRSFTEGTVGIAEAEYGDAGFQKKDQDPVKGNQRFKEKKGAEKLYKGWEMGREKHPEQWQGGARRGEKARFGQELSVASRRDQHALGEAGKKSSCLCEGNGERGVREKGQQVNVIR